MANITNMTNVNIRIDSDLKKQAEDLFNDFGINMTTAFTMFIKAVIRERKIPFEIASFGDNFYSQTNLKRLYESIKQLEEGDVVTKTLAELEAMENE